MICYDNVVPCNNRDFLCRCIWCLTVTQQHGRLSASPRSIQTRARRDCSCQHICTLFWYLTAIFRPCPSSLALSRHHRTILCVPSLYTRNPVDNINTQAIFLFGTYVQEENTGPCNLCRRSAGHSRCHSGSFLDYYRLPVHEHRWHICNL